jgi:hypothetical protein
VLLVVCCFGTFSAIIADNMKKYLPWFTLIALAVFVGGFVLYRVIDAIQKSEAAALDDRLAQRRVSGFASEPALPETLPA